MSLQASSVPVLGALVQLARRDPSTRGVRTGPAAFVFAVWLTRIQSISFFVSLNTQYSLTKYSFFFFFPFRQNKLQTLVNVMFVNKRRLD